MLFVPALLSLTNPITLPAVTEPVTILFVTSTFEEAPSILTNAFGTDVPTFLAVKPLMEGPLVVTLNIGFAIVRVVPSCVPITVSRFAFLATLTSGICIPDKSKHVKLVGDIE